MTNKELIKKLTLEEKVLLLSGENFWETSELKKYGIEKMFLADGPHGVRRQAAAADHLGLNESIKATCFPTAATLANTWNQKMIEKVGSHLGSEAKDQNVNILLGPGTNIKRNPLCGRNFEYYSEDPYLSGMMAASLIKGIESNGISACVKHFAANNQEERRLVIDTVVDERTLREIYLTPFEIAVNQGKVSALMTAYNKVNGIYANENDFLLKDILRDEWGFEGVVVSDWGGNNDRVLALKATSDLEMPGNKGETNLEVLKAVKAGKITEKELDDVVSRLLSLNFKTTKAIKEKEIIDYHLNHEVAYQAAQEAIVLLENKNNILPLDEHKKIAIIGDFADNPRYQGAGSSIVNPTKLDNTLDFINQYSENFVGYQKGFKRYGKKSRRLINKAVKLANKSDVVIVYLGLDEITEVEGIDRKNLKLPENQLKLLAELIKTNKKIIVVLQAGSVVEIDFSDKIDGLIHGYLLGQAGARALLDVIFGRVNPSGRLSETIPYQYQDVSSANYFPGKELSVEYREALYVGYRYFDKNNYRVRYPFGYGLSYTNFQYRDLKVTEKGVTFKIKNSGSRAGSEVAQLYLGLKDSKIFRAKKELKGFTKVFLNSNEEKEVFIAFDDYSFRYYNVLTKSYEIESGNYDIYINRSLNENVLQQSFYLAGTTTKLPYQNLKLPAYESGKITAVDLKEFETLLGFEAPKSERTFIKKKRLNVSYNTTIYELRYAQGWVGRLFSRAIRLTPKLLNFIGKKQTANTIIMGMLHQPVRGISRMSNGMISWHQLDGLILMFNGKFFKGLKKFLKEGKIKKRKARKENGK
ncbi:MAG: glycoside hydrolase family 3 C-terminal domain-containing protein [Acholeplasmatales bacterium]|jgi:beta-glucosidase|nr:glycoside hydrolase family 3 C-terminal domain-containing protein [Acholeplasmataceae bacterium]MCK9234102.1 glycoside hydrolase family 3 C-terminal domain-containing protein [Acholeplasmataceae bacterium]MCK9289597.1 glycoside hydrolase family 3 C-terminal domain-containing protein [Acholeplasmataceae bacterium]MCK9427986.1 glycoside hydrolase family 3 C-terminal domain-containing protein [Acholeplasmataceae bacterium]MDY0115640.1 glycoside hydrolase family 3 C-terminal domain-containing pr